MNIIYFSVVRYPTEKAYGVTIHYSFQALNQLGHQTRIISPQDLYANRNTKVSYRFLLFIAKHLESLQKIFEKKNIFFITRVISQTIYRGKIIIYAFSSRSIISTGTDLLWTREPLICLFNYRRVNVKKIVIEIHAKLGLLSKIIIKFTQKSGKIIIAPISIELRDSLYKSRIKLDRSRFVLSPMAVPDNFFGDTVYVHKQNKSDFHLGYVGNILSAGHDQKILDMISCIQKINESSAKQKTILHLYGIETEFVPVLKSSFAKLIDNDYLAINSRMSHNELIPKLRKCDAFILPYPEGNYFRNRFPLKALEYAALFRPILVTDTIAHRNIFDSSEVWFYSPENCLHLSNSINDLISDKGKVLKKLQNAYAKAQAHTYSRRVQDILDLLDL